MNDKTLRLPEQFLKEISSYDNIYIEVSGGYNSSVSVLLFYQDIFLKKNRLYQHIFLIHNDTKLQYDDSLDYYNKLKKKMEFDV